MILIIRQSDSSFDPARVSTTVSHLLSLFQREEQVGTQAPSPIRMMFPSHGECAASRPSFVD